MKVTLAQRLIASGAVLLAALVGLVIVEGNARAAGTEVILAMQPADPRSLLTGHYVQLAFVEEWPADRPCPPGAMDDHPWIALRRTDTHHQASGAAPDRAGALALGDVAMRGRMVCFTRDPGEVRLTLAVDRFHADQDEALAIEKAIRDSVGEGAPVYAILSVGKDGTPRAKGVIVNGRRVELTWF